MTSCIEGRLAVDLACGKVANSFAFAFVGAQAVREGRQELFRAPRETMQRLLHGILRDGVEKGNDTVALPQFYDGHSTVSLLLSLVCRFNGWGS